MKRISVGGSIARYAMAAFSNRRLIAADDGGVSFRWKAYRVEGPGRWKTMTLSPAEFIRRFLVYVLPKGFHRIRHYGLFANGNRTESIAKARELLAVAPLPPKPEPATASADDRLVRLKEFGLDHGVNYSRDDWVDQVRAITGGRGVDLVVDSVGGRILVGSVQCLAYRGRAVNVGNAGRDPQPLDVGMLWMGNQSLTGVFLGAEIGPEVYF